MKNISSSLLLYYFYFHMSGRSHSHVVCLGQQQMALEENTQNFKNIWLPLTQKRSILLQIRVFRNRKFVGSYMRIASTKYTSFNVINFSAVLTNCRSFTWIIFLSLCSDRVWWAFIQSVLFVTVHFKSLNPESWIPLLIPTWYTIL
jgi:hypothetical protein